QQVSRVADPKRNCLAAKLCEVNAGEETDRQPNSRGHADDHRAACDCIGQPAAVLTGRQGQPGEECPVYGFPAVINEVAQNQEQRRNREERAQAAQRQHHVVDCVSPCVAEAHALAEPFFVVSLIINCAEPFTTIVRTNSTRPSSISAERCNLSASANSLAITAAMEYPGANSEA